MSNRQRIEFVTRHFGHLQTIRFAPVPSTMLLVPIAVKWMPHVSRGVAWAMLSGFLLSIVGFYWWSTRAIRKRYGSVRLSRDEALRMRMHPVIFALNVVMVLILTWIYFSGSRTSYWNVYTPFTILLLMLQPVLDPTNLAIRRIAWGLGVLVLYTTIPLFLRFAPNMGEDGGAIALVGAVWLSLSIFDFLLLRRTVAAISASPPLPAAEPLVRLG